MLILGTEPLSVIFSFKRASIKTLLIRCLYKHHMMRLQCVWFSVFLLAFSAKLTRYLVDYLVPIRLIVEHYTPITLNIYGFKTYKYDDICQLSKIWLSLKF